MTKTIASNVVILKHDFQSLADFIKKSSYSKVAVLVDENTLKHCYPIVKDIFPLHEVFEIKSGEEQKNLQTCTYIWQKMTDLEFDRKALLVNLGGGVIGDMGGFCAATYKRGIQFINIPTTLLAQVDASVGGKLGIDFQGYKNHIGVFANPERVFVDVRFLQTLNSRELRSGYAEIIKHCLIADQGMWKLISGKGYNDHDWQELVKHSIEIKSDVVAKDPKEKGLRKILNFGHTLGHAVETYFLEKGQRILHGEAIAIGMIAESFLAVRKAGVSAEALNQIWKYILKIYGKVEIPAVIIPEIIVHTLQDKKNEKGVVKFSLLNKIGEANFDIPVNEEEMKEAILYYNNL